jgi:hypothetical protein
LEDGKTIPADLGMTYFTGGSAGTSPANTAAAGWVYATFFNKSDLDISFYWIPFSPNNTTKMLWKTLKPGKQFRQRTMKTMVWETKSVDTAGADFGYSGGFQAPQIGNLMSRLGSALEQAT